MKRSEFLKSLAILPVGAVFACQQLNEVAEGWGNTPKMPAMFIGHGSPMNAIEDNIFSDTWKRIGKELPKPNAILCISGHWETKGTMVTAMTAPKTIHDFGGFPAPLHQAQYPAEGSLWLVQEAKSSITTTTVGENQDWGLDHGCWSVLKNLYPEANIPVIQLSLDYTKGAAYHYELGQQLAKLRTKGVLILGSGNMVHNLRMIEIKNRDFNTAHGFDWALRMNSLFKDKILDGDHASLINYQTLDKAANLAVPTTDHYFPMLYALAVQDKADEIKIFNDQAVAGSLTMTSLLIES